MLQSNKIIILACALMFHHVDAKTNLHEQLKSFAKGAFNTTCAIATGYVIGKQIGYEYASAASSGLLMLALVHHLGKHDPHLIFRTGGAVVPLIIASQLFVNKVNTKKLEQEQQIAALKQQCQNALKESCRIDQNIARNNTTLRLHGLSLPVLSYRSSTSSSEASLLWLRNNNDTQAFQMWRKDAFEACEESSRGNFEDFCPECNDDAIAVLSRHICVIIQNPNFIFVSVNEGSDKRAFFITDEIAQKVLQCPTVRILSQEREQVIQQHNQRRREHEQFIRELEQTVSADTNALIQTIDEAGTDLHRRLDRLSLQTHELIDQLLEINHQRESTTQAQPTQNEQLLTQQEHSEEAMRNQRALLEHEELANPAIERNHQRRSLDGA